MRGRRCEASRREHVDSPRANMCGMKLFVRVAAPMAVAACLAAQGRDGFNGTFKDPAIAYETGALSDAVTHLAHCREVCRVAGHAAYLPLVNS